MNFQLFLAQILSPKSDNLPNKLSPNNLPAPWPKPARPANSTDPLHFQQLILALILI